jgi:colanic acid biosynthesis glycosyl transferase WcaI
MKILIYGINYSPEAIGIGKYTGEMASWLAKRGHTVRVVTAPPYYPHWKVFVGFRNRWEIQSDESIHEISDRALRGGRNERENGSLQIWRCPLWVPIKLSGMKRLMHLSSFALTSFPVMLRQIGWRPDVIWVVAPSLCCAPTAALVARLTGARAWLHIQDFEVDAAFEMGILHGNKLRRAITFVEGWLMQRFDVVSTISEQMQKKLLAKGVTKPAANLLANWVDMDLFIQSTNVDQLNYRRELDIDGDAIVAMYSGNMGAKQGLDILADLAKKCASDADLLQSRVKLIFIFCGNGIGRDTLFSLCEGLPNVRLLDLQPSERLADFLSMANIHLLPQLADVAGLVMPSKLTGMLASARPVVATAQIGTELWNVVRNCGLVVPPQDLDAMVHAVKTLALDPVLCGVFGKKGFNYAADNYSKNRVIEGFESKLFKITN